MNGLFCANFSHPRDCWAPCNQVWCGSCYSAHPLDRFPRYTPADEDGFEWHTPEDVLRYTHARDGDHLLTPFQCDLCVFRNLRKRNPIPDSNRDTALLCCIRRVNLDAVWGRESSTVANSLRGAVQLVQQWAKVGLEPTFPALGPYPVADTFGFSVAIGMVLKSMEPGRYDAYQQYETIRKLRAAYSNLYMASREGSNSLRSFGGDRVKHYLTDSPTQSLFFERFSQGCVRRMGQEVRQDWAITLPAMHALLEILKEDWGQGLNRELTAMVGAYAVIAFAGSFRGNEVFLADMHGVRKYFRSTEPPEDTVIIALLGRFKGETGERYHLAPMAAQTSSGIPIKRWVTRLVEWHEKRGYFRGPLFCDRTGQVVRPKIIELELMDRLQRVKNTRRGIIPEDVDVYEDFGISRSFRRGSTSTARTRGVEDKTVTLINRWRSFEQARGRRPAMSMKDHYSDIQILLPELIKYSLAL